MNATEIPLFSAAELPADFDAPGGHAWAQFRKTALTRAVRIDGPFRVETSESENEPFLCEDGWLAVDARGYPYAIADEEFRQIYEQADEDDSGPREGLSEIRAELRTVIALDNGETLQTIASRDSVVSAIQTVAKDGSDFFYVDPPNFHAQDATQQVGVRASRVVSVACRYEF